MQESQFNIGESLPIRLATGEGIIDLPVNYGTASECNLLSVNHFLRQVANSPEASRASSTPGRTVTRRPARDNIKRPFCRNSQRTSELKQIFSMFRGYSFMSN